MKRYVATPVWGIIASAVLLTAVSVFVSAFVVLFCLKTDETTIMLFFLLLFCSGPLLAAVVNGSYALFSIADFKNDSIHIRSLFQKNYSIEYGKCIDIGIGGYIHGRGGHGFFQSFIYFSKHKLSDEEKENINMIRMSDSFFRIAYNKKL